MTTLKGKPGSKTRQIEVLKLQVEVLREDNARLRKQVDDLELEAVGYLLNNNLRKPQ